MVLVCYWIIFHTSDIINMRCVDGVMAVNSRRWLDKILHQPVEEKGSRFAKSSKRYVKYFVFSTLFAIILALMFDRLLRNLFNEGGDAAGMVNGMFTMVISLVFAVLGVYLVILVLHPRFVKRPIPKSLRKILEENTIPEDMCREEIVEFISDLEANDSEIKEYLDSLSVKSDIAVTLAMSLMALFLGIYAYMVSYSITYGDITAITLCFAFTMFSMVYIILKTMRVVWEV